MSKLPERGTKDWLFVFIKGMAMGAADVVPGVSGGTIAFITGIYNELLYSLSQIHWHLFAVLRDQGILAVWRQVNGTFLLALFSGVLVSLFSLASVMAIAMTKYPVPVWAFFSGLILASIIYFARQQSGWGIKEWSACVLGAVFVFGISIATPTQLPGYPWLMFFGGFIAICAMILPGISGSFLLLLVGLYPVFLSALSEFEVGLIVSFGLGAICGLLAFTRFLHWLLRRHERVTLAVLIGFLIGSLNVTWPWKRVVETMIDRHGELVPLVQTNVMPEQFSQLNGQEAMLITALASFSLGLFLVLFTEYISNKLEKTHT